jgi:hypothetical protein
MNEWRTGAMKTRQRPINKSEQSVSLSVNRESANPTPSMRDVLGWVIPVLRSILIAGFVMTGSAFAQTAQLSGVISDPSGGRVPKANVTVLNKDTGINRVTESNGEGYYAVPLLQPGSYMVTVKAAGFATQVRTSVTLEVGQQQVLNFNLKVGNIAQTVQVTVEAPTVELASSSLDAQISSTTVRELPLNGRSWSDLANLQPGVNAIQTQQPFSAGPSRGGRGFGDQITVAGARPIQNNYRLDGITVNDYVNGSPGSVLGGNLGVDAIQEFSVLTTNYSAEYGRTAGGVVNAVTRTGTNEFHGSIYEFLRNSALDARNFFDGSTIPPFRRNQFGAAVGGPIRKDKLFIFGDYEGIRQSKGITNVDTVPSVAARNGTLCSVPDTTPTCTPTPIPGGVDASAQKYLPLWPSPNRGIFPGTNGDIGIFAFAAQQVVNENFGTTRLDYKISDKDELAATFLVDKTPYTSPDGMDAVQVVSYTNRYFTTIEETHTFSPTIVNSVRSGYSRDNALLADNTVAINPLAQDPSLAAVPGQFAAIVDVSGLTSFTGGLHSGPSDHFFWNSYQMYDDLFWTYRTHSLKFGVAVERMDLNFSPAPEASGHYAFGSLAAFLENQPSRFTYGPLLTGNKGLRQTLLGLYVQDDWRARPSLTINLGLRWEMVTVPTEAANRLANLINLTDATPHIGSPLVSNSTLRNFEPRVGFAWDPFHNGKTAVRGGFGIVDDLPLVFQYTKLENQAFPFTLTRASSKLPPGSFFAGTLPVLSPASNREAYFEQHAHRSYVMQWNLNVQRQFASNLTGMVGYVGTHGVHLADRIDDASIVLPTLTSAGWLFPSPVTTGTTINPNFTNLRAMFYGGDSFYDALVVAVQKTMSHGLQLQASFTWGKSIDEGGSVIAGDQFSNSISSLPWYDLRSVRGLSDFDIGRTLVINGNWQVPSPKSLSGFEHWITDGWELGAIFKVNDGVPFTPTFGTDADPQGINSADPWDFPNRLTGPGCSTLTNPGNPNNYIKTQCFRLPIAPNMPFWQASCDTTSHIYGPNLTTEPFPVCFNLRGNSGRNIVIGPGLENLDFSLFKNNHINRISENLNVQFRAEVFNILNRPNFAVPVTPNNTDIFNSAGLPTGVAGLLTSTATTAREIQFALKLSW